MLAIYRCNPIPDLPKRHEIGSGSESWEDLCLAKAVKLVSGSLPGVQSVAERLDQLDSDLFEFGFVPAIPRNAE